MTTKTNVKESLERKCQVDCRFEVKSLSVTGQFTGYASVYDVVDDGDEIILKGAFAESLNEWRIKGQMPALLWQHRSDPPIGIPTSITEDDHGLLVEGQLALKTQQGAEAYELLKMGAISGLSVGFKCDAGNDTYDYKTGIRSIIKADLWEYSLVTFPMNDDARVSSIKSLDSIEQITDYKSAEAYLRDSGEFSRKEATAFLSRVKSLVQRDSDADAETKQVIAALCRRTKLLNS